MKNSSMAKYFIYIFLLVLISCKEVYEPDINNEQSALVIQGLMTNIEGQLSVRIYKAVPYDSTDNTIPVKGASVYVYDDLWNMNMLIDNGFGVYVNNSTRCEPGRSYFLKVVTSDGSIYQSSLQTLPQPFKQDSIYAENILKTSFSPDAYGNYFKTQTRGIETYVDLSSNSNVFPKVRYDVRATIMYTYIPPQVIMPPTHYCWKTFNPNLSTNITSTRFDKVIGVVNKHAISFFSGNVSLYDDRENIALAGWLLTITKYSQSNEAHQFYLKMKSQLEASGKIFDPVPAQIIGNMKCINYPEKLVLGFFEVSYAEKLYYRYNLTKEPFSLIKKDNFPGFSNEGEVLNVPPLFWYY